VVVDEQKKVFGSFFEKKMAKSFVSSEKSITFAPAIERDAP